MYLDGHSETTKLCLNRTDATGRRCVWCSGACGNDQSCEPVDYLLQLAEHFSCEWQKWSNHHMQKSFQDLQVDSATYWYFGLWLWKPPCETYSGGMGPSRNPLRLHNAAPPQRPFPTSHLAVWRYLDLVFWLGISWPRLLSWQILENCVEKYLCQPRCTCFILFLRNAELWRRTFGKLSSMPAFTCPPETLSLVRYSLIISRYVQNIPQYWISVYGPTELLWADDMHWTVIEVAFFGPMVSRYHWVRRHALFPMG